MVPVVSFIEESRKLTLLWWFADRRRRHEYYVWRSTTNQHICTEKCKTSRTERWNWREKGLKGSWLQYNDGCSVMLFECITRISTCNIISIQYVISSGQSSKSFLVGHRHMAKEQQIISKARPIHATLQHTSSIQYIHSYIATKSNQFISGLSSLLQSSRWIFLKTSTGYILTQWGWGGERGGVNMSRFNPYFFHYWVWLSTCLIKLGRLWLSNGMTFCHTTNSRHVFNCVYRKSYRISKMLEMR